jgi:nucleotide-binding universal stress UspA family protein
VRSILVAVDGSSASDEALEVALRLAHESGAGVTAVAVSPLLSLPLHSSTTSALALAEEEPQVAAVLEAARQRAAHAGLELHVVESSGDAGPAICAAADDIDADVVVVGSRGLGGFTAAVIGSVSRDVVARTVRPVLVVKHRPQPAGWIV